MKDFTGDDDTGKRCLRLSRRRHRRLKTTASGNFTLYQLCRQEIDLTMVFGSSLSAAWAGMGDRRIDAPSRLESLGRETLPRRRDFIGRSQPAQAIAARPTARP